MSSGRDRDTDVDAVRNRHTYAERRRISGRITRSSGRVRSVCRFRGRVYGVGGVMYFKKLKRPHQKRFEEKLVDCVPFYEKICMIKIRTKII